MKNISPLQKTYTFSSFDLKHLTLQGEEKMFQKRCWCIFTIYLALVCLLAFSMVTFSQLENTLELSQEEQDDLDLPDLDPFRDLKKIKDIAARKFHYRRSILQEACRKIKCKLQSR